MEVDQILVRDHEDVRPVVQDGAIIGVEFRRLQNTQSNRRNQDKISLAFPRAIWHAHHPQSGQWFGWTVLAAAFSPWWDKHGSGGALDVRRLFMTKDGYRGTRIYYPSGYSTVQQPDGSTKQIPNHEIAMQIVETIRTGGVFALPSEVDANGTPRWKVEESQVSNNPSHILQYPKELDAEILNAMGIADDVLKSEATGSWAGKAVPQQATYCILEQWLSDLICDVDRVLEKLVEINFGPGHQYEITTRPLADQMLAQQNGAAPSVDTDTATRMSFEDPSWLRMGARHNLHAPVGGINVGGKEFEGGWFIPKVGGDRQDLFVQQPHSRDESSEEDSIQEEQSSSDFLDFESDGEPQDQSPSDSPDTRPRLQLPNLDMLWRTNPQAYAYWYGISFEAMATAERDAKEDAALEELLARNPEWLDAYEDKYGKEGMDRLREAFRWGYTVEEHRHWWSHWSVDETTRTISLDADIWWKHSPEFVADKLHAALNSKYVHPPKTEDVYILQPGDIETWDGAGNQHQQFDVARAQAAIVVRQTAQDVTIEVASLGATDGLTFAVRKLDQASEIVKSISWIESGIERARATGSPALRPLQQALLDLRHRLATLVTAVDNVADNVIGKLDDAPRVNPRSRLPQNYGKWIKGTRGDGFWKSDLPEVNAITKNKPIKFVNGRPVFTPWSKGKITFKPGELDGSPKDFDKVYERIMEQKGLSSPNAAKTYLSNARLTPHHLNSTTVELIPMDLHSNVPHIGSASDLRGGY